MRESEERYRMLADALDTQVQFRTQELREETRPYVIFRGDSWSLKITSGAHSTGTAR